MTDQKGLHSITVGYAGSINGSGVPKRMSPNALPVCGTEWSWSPAHSRVDHYSLHSGKTDWFLWLSFYDDCSGKIERDIVARMPKNDVNAEDAAKALLTEFWKFDYNECDIDRPHCCDPGALSSDVLEKIMDTVWDINSLVPAELIAAYKNTDFQVLEPRKFTLRIDERSSELVELYSELGITSAGFLTAWNPHSNTVSAQQNKLAQDALRKRLSLEGLATLNAIGIDPSGQWPGEESIFVPGLSLECAEALGAEFGQNAVVWMGADAIPQLIVLR